MKAIAAAVVIALAAVTAACSKPQQPKVETKALDTAKGLQADLNRKAQDNLDTADKLSR